MTLAWNNRLIIEDMLDRFYTQKEIAKRMLNIKITFITLKTGVCFIRQFFCLKLYTFSKFFI